MTRSLTLIGLPRAGKSSKPHVINTQIENMFQKDRWTKFNSV